MDTPGTPEKPDLPSADHPSLDRRRFIHVLTAGVAAILAGRIPGARAAAAPKPSTRGAAGRKPAAPIAASIERELRNQEKSLAETLKVVRGYELPPGSEPATVFRALRARRGARR